ncbi:MAG: hypothetical protein JXB50_01700 [Spirochaetes bacterium]|nr:hypothetical protein [Spirochaetota bacterium]
MLKNEEKYIDLELFVFYFIVALMTFFIYIFRHPIFYILNDNRINFYALFSAYAIDLIIFLTIFIPYEVILIVLIINKILKKINIIDNIIIVLFFPLLSLFTKGMSFMHVYTEISIKEIFINNYIFFSFIILGPVILLGHWLVIQLKNIKKK